MRAHVGVCVAVSAAAAFVRQNAAGIEGSEERVRIEGSEERASARMVHDAGKRDAFRVWDLGFRV